MATKLFAFEEFERKYEGPNKLLRDFSTLGQILVKEKSLAENSPQISDANKQEKQEMVTTTVNKAPPISPGQKYSFFFWKFHENEVIIDGSLLFLQKTFIKKGNVGKGDKATEASFRI